MDTNTVLVAAVAAYRINNNRVVKYQTGIPGNKEMVLDYLEDSTKLDITEEDKQLADDIYTHLTQSITMAALTGKHLGAFNLTISEILSRPTMSLRNVGILVWAPKIYKDSLHQLDIAESVNRHAFTSKYTGTVKQRISVDVEILFKRYVREYTCNRYVAVTPEGNLVGFLSKLDFNLGTKTKINGRVKGHQPSKMFSMAKITYLNYVKV